MKRTNFILQAAVAAAFGVTAAHAATFNGAGPTFAKEALKGADSTTLVNFGAGSNASVVVTGTEGYINRLQPLNIKVQLNGGAKFGGAVAATNYIFASFDSTGAVLAGTSFTAGATATHVLPATVVGGGNVGDTFVTFSVDPTGTGLAKGGINLGALVLESIDKTLAVGSSVTADITLIDPTTNTTLDSLTGKTIASAANAVSAVFTAKSSPQQIDVAQNSTAFTGSTHDFNAGTVAVTINQSYLVPAGTLVTAGVATVVNMQIAGLTSFDAFAHAGGVYMSAGGATTGILSASATPSTASGAAFVANGTAFGAGTNTPATVWFNGDDTTAIEEGTPTAQMTGGTFDGFTTSIAASSVGSLAAMAKNGYTAKYPLVFASGDSALGTTYVRLVNNTSVAGKVYFTFKDASGAVVGTASASANVAAKQALLWTDSDIEALTGALPTGAFYRLEISSTLPASGVVTQAYVLTPNMSINNITDEKSSN